MNEIYTITTPGYEQYLLTPSHMVLETDEITSLVNRMLGAMQKENGVGIAAPQIGVNKSIAIITSNGGPIIMINPIIIGTSKDLVQHEEGCLSIPKEFFSLIRYKEVTVFFKDLKWKSHTEKFTGLTSIIVQHEIDHLFGIIISQRGERVCGKVQ